MEVNEQGSALTEPVSEQGQDQSQAVKEEKLVKYGDHKRAIDDMLKFKAVAKESQTKLADLEARLQALTDEKARAEGNKDQLLADYENRWKKAENEKKQIMESLYTSKKYDAVYAEAVKAGLRKEAESDLNLLDLDGVEVERTDAGRVLVHGHSEYIEKLKQARPHWFQANGSPQVNTGGAKQFPNGESITADQLAVLAAKDPKKYREQLQLYIDKKKQSKQGRLQ